MNNSAFIYQSNLTVTSEDLKDNMISGLKSMAGGGRNAVRSPLTELENRCCRLWGRRRKENKREA